MFGCPELFMVTDCQRLTIRFVPAAAPSRVSHPGFMAVQKPSLVWWPKHFEIMAKALVKSCSLSMISICTSDTFCNLGSAILAYRGMLLRIEGGRW